MSTPSARVGGKSPAPSRGTRRRPQALKIEGRAEGQTRIAPPDDSNLSEDQRGAESGGDVSTDGALERMNETLKRLHTSEHLPHSSNMPRKRRKEL